MSAILSHKNDLLKLIADLTYYIATTGSDSNDGSALNPWLTVQHAVDYIKSNILLNGYRITLQLADGTYADSILADGSFNNADTVVPSVTIKGNLTDPENVIIHTAGHCLTAVGNSNSPINIEYCKLKSDAGNCLFAYQQGNIRYNNLIFDSASIHILAQHLSSIKCSGNYEISGGALFHVVGSINSAIEIVGRTITLAGIPAFSLIFALVEKMSYLGIDGCTFAGTATGKRYQASVNSLIWAFGGANYLPGNVAGTTDNQGIYL